MLTPNQIANLRAAADCVIPADADTASATDAGVMAYLLYGLNGGHLAEQIGACAAFLNELGADFSTLSFDSQNERLRENEKHPFFSTFVEWVHEGFWTSPAGLNLVGFTITG